MAMLVAGTVPCPCVFSQKTDAGVGGVGRGGVGWGWWRSLHLYTCDMLRNCWGGGLGWVGDDDVLCTCTHVTCYATAGVVGWGGLGMMTFFALAHMWHATQLLGWWGGVGWGRWRSLHLHTCDMLRNCWGGGVGWVGDDDVLCTCTHVTCYATAGVVGWGGLGMMTFFALVHMWHATQLLGRWGGVGWGWWRSLHLHTCDMLRNCWGGRVGWVGDDDVLCTCTHVACYATAGVVGWGGVGWGWWRCFNGCCAATLWKLAWRRHKSFSPNRVVLHLASIGGKKN